MRIMVKLTARPSMYDSLTDNERNAKVQAQFRAQEATKQMINQTTDRKRNAKTADKKVSHTTSKHGKRL